MFELTEPTAAAAFAVLGVVGTLVWYALAWYGIRTLQDVRDVIDTEKPNRG